MINFCKIANQAEVVAICDKNEQILEKQKEQPGSEHVTFYKSFDEFICHDMDAVVLANYANEHAPFAIKCLERGLHVYSEVLPVQTMKEAVELIEAVEKSGKVYAYGENYCFMPAPREMKRLYHEGKIGEFEYGEGEYIHNCEPIWASITYGEEDHWRNNMYATYYCTHSLGPIIHMTGLRPVRVTGFEGGMNERRLRVGSKAGSFGMEMVELENGGIVKSIHGDLYKNSIWYTVYGSKGRMESGREDAGSSVATIYVNADEYSGEYGASHLTSYDPKNTDERVNDFGHGGSDYYTMFYFLQRILGDKDADIIDVYEALDMFLPGLFAYRSVLEGGVPMEVPDLRNPALRDAYRSDVLCTDPKVAGDMLIPCFSKGNPEIPAAVYQNMREKFEQDLASESGYAHAALTQGSHKEKADQ
jgi:predicted dehydrogenase